MVIISEHNAIVSSKNFLPFPKNRKKRYFTHDVNGSVCSKSKSA